MRIALFAIAFLASSFAAAARPGYTYLGLSYVQDRYTDGNECTQDGGQLEASLVLNELFFVQMSHVDATSDDDWCGSTTTAFSGGFRSPMGADSSFYGQALIIRHDRGNETDPGVGVESGVRTIWGRSWESKFFVGYEIIDEDEFSYLGVGFNKGLNHRVSLFGDLYSTNEDKTGLSLGIRFNF